MRLSNYPMLLRFLSLSPESQSFVNCKNETCATKIVLNSVLSAIMIIAIEDCDSKRRSFESKNFKFFMPIEACN
jgi:hypothetical protein